MKYFLAIVALLTLVIPLVLHFRKVKKVSVPKLTEGNQMDADQLKECLDMNNQWINACDQKAGLLLATIGVVFTVFLTSDAIKVFRNYIFQPFLKWYNDDQTIGFCYSRFVVFFLLVMTSIFAVLSLLYLLSSIKPDIDYNKMVDDNPDMAKKSYIFYGSVANMNYEEFNTAKFDYENDLRSQVYTNAKIAFTKFQNYLEGFFWFKMMMLSAALLFISVMLMS